MTTAQRASAYASIAAKGQTVVLTRTTEGAYDPATGSSSTSTSTQTGKGVILPLSAGVKYLGGTNIPKGAKQCLLAGLGTDGVALALPHAGDKLTASGVDYTVSEVSPLEPAGMPIIFDLTIVGAQ